MRIEKSTRLCSVFTRCSHQIEVFGANFDPKGSCKIVIKDKQIFGDYEYINHDHIFCHVEKLDKGSVQVVIKTQDDIEDKLEMMVYDPNCQDCQSFMGVIKCSQKEHVCSLNGTCHKQGQVHPGDECLHCVEGRWIRKSDGFVSVATSELNKKFKVINGDVFDYELPKIDNATEFQLISGPYGASVMDNGTLSWKAMSNLIADAWSELFIIKAKGMLKSAVCLLFKQLFIFSRTM